MQFLTVRFVTHKARNCLVLNPFLVKFYIIILSLKSLWYETFLLKINWWCFMSFSAPPFLCPTAGHHGPECLRIVEYDLRKTFWTQLDFRWSVLHSLCLSFGKKLQRSTIKFYLKKKSIDWIRHSFIESISLLNITYECDDVLVEHWVPSKCRHIIHTHKSFFCKDLSNLL